MIAERFRGRMGGLRRWFGASISGSTQAAMERQLRELQVLHAVAVAGAESNNEQELIDRATSLIGDTFYSDNFGILLLDEGQQLLVHHPSYRAGADAPEQRPISLEEGICGEVARTAIPRRIDDVTRNDAYLDIDPNTVSELCVPIKVGHRVIGVINAESRLRAAFTEDDERLLTTLAGQLGPAIQRTRLLESERVRWQEAEVLRHATAGITSSLELSNVLDRILEFLDQVVPYDSASIFLVEGSHLKCVACRKFESPEKVTDQEYPAQDDPLFLEIQSSAKTMILDDVAQDRRFKQWGNTSYVHGWMGVPLVVRNQVIGLLTLDSRRPGAYGVEHAGLAQALANQAAVAIDNARLYEESQRQAIELAGLYEASLTISSVLVTEALLARLGEQVNRYFSPDSFGLFIYREDTDEVEISMAIENGREIPGLVGSRIPVDDSGLTGWVIRSREPLLIKDLAKEDLPVEPRHLTSTARAWFGVPLIARDRLLGVISLQSFQPHTYNQSDMRLLQSLAAQVATALENVRLYEEARRGFERQEALNAVIATAASETELRKILSIALDRTMRAMDLSSGGIWVGDVTITRELPEHFITKLQETSAATGIGMDDLEETVVIRDWAAVKRDDPYQPFAKWFLKMGIHTSVMAPIKADGQTTGGLYLFPRGRTKWSRDDVSFVETVGKQLGGAIEKLRLFNQAEVNAFTLATLFEAGREISTTIELEPLLELICRRAVQLTEADRSLVILFSDESYKVANSAHLGFDGSLNNRDITDAFYDLSTWVMEHRKPAIVADYSEDPRGGTSRSAELEWISEIVGPALALPLNTADKALGALLLMRNPGRRAFDTEDLDLLLMMVGQATMALGNASLFDEVRKHALYQSALLTLSTELASALDIDEICDRVVTSLQELLGYENVGIFLVDEFTGERVLTSSVGLFEAPDNWRLERGAGVSERPLIDGKLHYTPDVTADPDYIPGLPSGAEVDVPIRIDGKNIGVLIVQKLDPNSFYQEDFRVLQAAASQAGSAISRAKLLETERRRGAEFEALRQASLQVTSSLELKPVLDAILEQTLRLIPADDAHIFLYESGSLSFGAARTADDLLEKPLYEPRSDGLSNKVASEGVSVFVPDTESHPVFNYSNWSGAVASLPLVIGQEVRGVMNLAFNRVHEFKNSEVQVLELLADQAAIALNNARSFQFATSAIKNAQERLDEMSAIAEVSSAMR
ncbi:MAG: GAF domain-containing protein, partial [Anaerolineales bacterium]|nr:GAF domain-containing protein [Anaerolineales bacterium]